jgi:hypothetical protein
MERNRAQDDSPEVSGGDDAPDSSSAGRAVHRSPAYPYVSLPAAIDLARKVHMAEGRHPVRYEIVAKHWGLAAKSSGVAQSVGALRAFGLMEVQSGQGRERTVSLTERALKIILDKRPEQRLQPLREAALAPKLYAELWAKWGTSPPSPDNAESYLVVDRKFNPAYVKGVLANYKASIAVAELGDSGSLPEGSHDESGTEQGDMDQEIASEGRSEGSPTPAPTGGKRAPVVMGEEEYFRTKLAGGRMVRVLFQGTAPTRASIDKLIAHLQLVKDDFPDDEESSQ